MQAYSISEAKMHFPRIVHEVENAGTIHLTRYGKPVAVILSESEYAELKYGQQVTSKQALQAFLANDEFKDIDVNTKLFDQDKSKQQERSFHF